MKKPVKKAPSKSSSKAPSKAPSKKKISEYGGMEKYASKKAEMKHEKGEGKAMEKKEKMMFAKKKKK